LLDIQVSGVSSRDKQMVKILKLQSVGCYMILETLEIQECDKVVRVNENFLQTFLNKLSTLKSFMFNFSNV
jgi:hypothetical protein